ncbi:hypothetical protein [Sphingomonas alpina]|uniref:hypothetical protein n=1 Tax=Sphingomonas alpina TaxID=653931 RepID=UPI0021BB44F8|nr:hypothetical protein [Sphingomonas alpina]
MSWTTWTIHDVIFLPFLMVTLLVTFSARERLRMKAPKTRLAIGGAGICLSLIIFFAIMRLLPKPDPGADSLAHDIALIASCSFFAGLLILSATQIIGGAVQVFKRWRYYRRNAR